MPPPEDWYGRTIAVSAALFLGTLLVVSRAIGNEFGRSLRNRSSGCLDWPGDPPQSSRVLGSFAVMPSASEAPHLSRRATQNSLHDNPC